MQKDEKQAISLPKEFLMRQDESEQSALSENENIVNDDLEIISNNSSSSSSPNFITSNNPKLERSCSNTKFSPSHKNECLKKLIKYRGYFLGICAAFLLSFSKVILKKSPLLAGSDHSLIRYVIQFIFLFGIIKYKKLNLLGPNPKVRKMLSFRGFVGAIGMIFLHFAITMIAPSDTVAVTHSSVIITAILARIFLKERFSIAHILSLILTVIGILFISQPSFLFKKMQKHPTLSLLSNSKYGNVNASYNLKNFTSIKNSKVFENTMINYSLYIGIFLTLCGALTTGIVQIAVKHLCNKKVHYSIIIIFSSYFGMPLSLLISLALYFTGVSYKNLNSFDTQSILLQVFYSFFSAVVGLAAQICLSLALKYEEASKIAIIKTTDLIFTFIFQSYLVNIEKDYLSSIGAYLILGGAFLVFVFKFIEKKFNHNKAEIKSTKDKHLLNENNEAVVANSTDENLDERFKNNNKSQNKFSYKTFFKMFIFFKF
jgi:drug/metabolite transporter (DMT)-like permease